VKLNQKRALVRVYSGLRHYSHESPEDEESADATTECEQDCEDDDDGEKGGGEAPDQVRLALHLAVVPDHAAWARALTHDPGHITAEPKSLKSKVNVSIKDVRYH
jgi:hypothetical protein